MHSHPAASASIAIDKPRHAILPGLVNAHAHLDLTHIGPRSFDSADGFAGWARTITHLRSENGKCIRDSVRSGLRLSLAGGVMAIGDIAGAWRTEPIEELCRSDLLGVSFLEIFGVGADRERSSAARLERAIEQSPIQPSTARVRMGISPHAPYSVGPELMRRAAELASAHSLRLTTHLAESSEERRVLARADGPIRFLLEDLGLWSDEVHDRLVGSASPVSKVMEAVGGGSLLAVHVCDASDEDIEILARSGSSVAYCPRASEYFRYAESLGPHRYRDMLDAGINVALGTDSIVCHPPEQADRISTLDEMRLLHRRDGTDPDTLLRMATVNGAVGLGLDASCFRLEEDSIVAGVIAVELLDSRRSADPLAHVLTSSSGIEIVAGPRGDVAAIV